MSPATGSSSTPGSMFPPEYKNRAFLAQRGSWNRTKKIGFRVMMVTLRPGDVPKYDVFAEGWLDGDTRVGPARLHQADEGRLAADRRRLRGRDLPHHATSPERCCRRGAAHLRGLGGRRPPRDARWRQAAGAAADLEAGQRKAEVVRGLPWARRQCDDSRDAVARGAAGLLHALAAHQVQGRAAQGPPDDALRPEPERRRHGRPRRLLPDPDTPTPSRSPPIPPRSPKGSASPTRTTAPPATAPASPARSKPRASPARTSTTSSGSCAASRPRPPPTSTAP